MIKTLITATAMLTVVTLLVALCVNVKMDFPVMVSHALVSFMLLDIVYVLYAQIVLFFIVCD